MADPHGDMLVFPPSSDWTISITVRADPLIRLDLSTSDGMDDLLIPTSNWMDVLLICLVLPSRDWTIHSHSSG